MKRFELHRDEDETGISGTGIVAEGVQFYDGTCALRWRSPLKSTAVYESITVVEALHGHAGRTRIVWLDPGHDEESYRAGWQACREYVRSTLGGVVFEVEPQAP